MPDAGSAKSGNHENQAVVPLPGIQAFNHCGVLSGLQAGTRPAQEETGDIVGLGPRKQGFSIAMGAT